MTTNEHLQQIRYDITATYKSKILCKKSYMTKNLTKLLDMYLELCQTSMMEFFGKIVNGL